MNAKGLRISDIKDNKCIPLFEILETIPNASQLNWALLWFDVTAINNEAEEIIELEGKVNKYKDGIFYEFESLVNLSRKIFQEIEVLIIGCRIKENLHRYEEDQKMYETCDIVIEMIDGGFWEVFSNDKNWIDQLEKKYKDIQFLAPDFQKRLYEN